MSRHEEHEIDKTFRAFQQYVPEHHPGWTVCDLKFGLLNASYEYQYRNAKNHFRGRQHIDYRLFETSESVFSAFQDSFESLGPRAEQPKTLRDEFAMFAIGRLVSLCSINDRTGEIEEMAPEIAKAAYQIADEMLKARQR